MKEPTTPEEFRKLHDLRRSDPQRYLRITNEWIRDNPNNSQAYFRRHLAWMNVGEPRRALEDLDRFIQLKPGQPGFLARGRVYRQMGEYQNAIEDFGRGEALNSAEWQSHALGLLYQADCHAQLGDEAKALEYCGRLPENFWTPGLDGAPAGSKTDIADELRRIAGRARSRSK